MRINTNVSSLTAQEAAQNTTKTITSSLEKLSTGLKINKASDDASGLAIADKLRTQVNFVQIYNDGSWLWHEVYNSRINKMPFFKTMFLDRDKRIIFLGHYNDNNVIGSFETRY